MFWTHKNYMVRTAWFCCLSAAKASLEVPDLSHAPPGCDHFPGYLLLLLMCDTEASILVHILCVYMALSLLKKIPRRTQHLLKISDICLIPRMSLTKMIYRNTRQQGLGWLECFQHWVCHWKQEGLQACLQLPGSSLGRTEQPWLEEQTLVWLCLHDSALSVAQSQPQAILKAVTEGQSQCTVLSRPESSGKPGVLPGVMLSHHWPWGDAACGTALMRDSANDVKGQSESFPFGVASQNF